MGKFVITSSKVNKTYEFTNEDLQVNGSYVADEITGVLQSIQGTCFRNNPGGGTSDYIGNFNGTMRNGEIKYSLSEMSRKDSMLVWNAIDEIEQNILPQEEL